ncbi:hypothetical protein [Lentzea sp. NBRC 102530]|uniref:hypothetical protein n=1 Tax=Lentzea sp. NBRC 102530 TaxID=3032201 RepID=UPI0024A0C075|nr:hypothetical protein [Lentzea sp. NBRC 102530]GLY54837.1 hypothetical protein Lesp01_84920 [Lentzea sp. NBRC 102530]
MNLSAIARACAVGSAGGVEATGGTPGALGTVLLARADELEELDDGVDVDELGTVVLLVDGATLVDDEAGVVTADLTVVTTIVTAARASSAMAKFLRDRIGHPQNLL